MSALHRLGVFLYEDTAVTLPDDPDVPDDDELQAMRTQLTQRINASHPPSLLINRLAIADLRCADSQKWLSRLISGAPKVLRVIRAELHKAFGLDPNNVLFTEPKPPAAAQKVDSLTDRTLRLLVLPSVSINVNQFTALSLKDDPARRVPFTPLEALQRVVALNLFERLARAQSDYWQALVPGSWLTRNERWVELYKHLFADQAFVARQLGELSSAGLVMVQALVDAPTAEARRRAGEQWASLQVCKVMWPGAQTRLTPIPGALHIYREGDPAGMPHVMYLPGVHRNYYEYPSFEQLQCGLVALINSALFDDLWQCLPLRRRHEVCRPAEDAAATGLASVRGLALRDDALAISAQAVLDGQWENELACALSINLAQVFSGRREPSVMNAARFLAYIQGTRKHWVGRARLGSIRRELLEWDQHRRRHEIIFASTAPGLALNTARQQVKRYERALMTLLNPQDPGADTQAFREFVALEDQLKVQAAALRTLIQDAQLQLFDVAFWAARPTGKPRHVTALIRVWIDRLRGEIQLQHQLKLISKTYLDLMIDVLDKPLASKRQGSETRVLSVLVGAEPDADTYHPLHSVFAVTLAAAVSDHSRRVPVVLCVLGREGGVVTFGSLGALTLGIQASLGSRDESVLWRYVTRQKRKAVREHVACQTLAVRYEPIEGNPVMLAVKRLLKSYILVHRSIDGGASIFSETDNALLSRLLLAVELDEHLSAPANDALVQARTDFDVVRKAAAAKQRMPAWITDATGGQRKRFKYLQGRYLGSALAFEDRLEQRLPDLPTFARELLIARLREDGLYPQLDIDTPFIEMPDQVSGRFCGWESACTVGDRKEILTPSDERTRFSLLQLALHNLDPQIKPTRWRFKYAEYLKPAWKQQLPPQYLISMVSALDIGGRYEALISSVFYPADVGRRRLSDSRVPELLTRVLQAGTEANLYSAVQQGLTESAQSLFNTAMAARTPQDLNKHGHQVQLYVVHLVGHTLQHDRYMAGILVFHDLLSQHCLVYWPAAPDARSISEHVSLQHAREHLNRIGSLPGNVTALARQVAPGWAFEAITHHPGETFEEPLFNPLSLIPGFHMLQGIWRGVEFVRSFKIKHLVPTAHVDEIEKQTLEQIASDPLNWLALVPTSHCDTGALLYRAWMFELQRQAQANSNSNKVLDKYREQRRKEERDTRTRALLSIGSPLFDLGNQLYELLLTSRRYHRSGDPRDAVDVAFGTIFLAVELLLNFVPGPKPKSGTLVRPRIGSIGTGLNRIHRAAVSQVGRVFDVPKPPSTISRLKPLERFRTEGVPQDAVALKGPGEKGIYVKGGEYFTVDDTHHIPIYRRDNERSFRLKNREAPGEDELILNTSVNREVLVTREVLLGADAPVAGPSSGVLHPWRASVEPVDWRPPTVRSATESRIYQSSVSGTDWFSWRTHASEGQIAAPSAHGVSRVHIAPPGFSYDAIYVGSWYDTATESGAGHYRLLYQGDQAPLDKIAFIARDEPLVSKAHVDIERWTSTAAARLEQPIPVSRGPTGEWQLHAPLFHRSLEHSVGTAFPTMTTHSRRFLVVRMIELADASRPVTASHLLNIRATLDNWLPAAAGSLGQTDEVLQMLRAVKVKPNVFVGYEGKAPGFTRVDFRPSVALDPTLKPGGSQVLAARNTAQRAQVRTVLEQQGFNCQDVQVKRANALSHELIATHPNSNKLYYVSYHWIEHGSIKLMRRFTDEWLNYAIKKNPDSLAFTGVRSAMREQRLTRIVAGIHWPKKGMLPPTVYFVKVSPLAP